MTPLTHRPSGPFALTLAAALLITIAPAPVAAQAQAPLPTVATVDLERYAGTWHEIARLPNRFQAQCVADVTATYTPRADGAVGVVNRCRTAAGGTDVAEGVAVPQDETRARLKVSFLPAVLRWLPFGQGDYWVLALDAQYRWVLVGEPRREYLWVLAREPRMAPDTLQGVLDRARELGFPVERIRIGTPTDPAR